MRGRDKQTGQYVHLPDPGEGAITAAVSTIPTRDIDRLPRSPEGWQERAWKLWRILGVLHQPTSAKANQVGRLEWHVEVDGKELEHDAGMAAVEAICAPLTVAEAARRLALNFEIAGEVFYCRIANAWNVYAPTTPRLKDILKKADIVVRGWQADPEMPDKPDCSVRAALDTAEQVRLMSALLRSQTRNRMHNGILFKPKEGQFPEGDTFQADLEEAMVTPIADEYHATAGTPLVVTFPADLIEKWRYMDMANPYDEKLPDKIEAAVKQFALELDFPPEALLGNMDSNHWNAWLSSEENYRSHVGPAGGRVGEVFAEAMIQAVPGVSSVRVTPDPAELLVREASTDEAISGAKIGAVSLEFVRSKMGATDEDAQPPEDTDVILALLGNASQPAPAVSPEPKQAAPQTPETQPVNGQPVAASLTPREKELDRLGRQLMHIDVQLLGTLKGAAQMAVETAREKLDTEDEVGKRARIEREMARLGKTWKRTLDDARMSLTALGFDTSGHAWDEAQSLSVKELVDGMTAYVERTIDLTDAQMPALPTDLLRSVIATAGGSRTAVVA